jgi:hypothetical protein
MYVRNARCSRKVGMRCEVVMRHARRRTMGVVEVHNTGVSMNSAMADWLHSVACTYIA